MKIDPNNLDRLKVLISLKSRCLYWDAFYKSFFDRQFSSDSFERLFFSDLNDEINVPLIYMLNDEFTNIKGRDEIGLLIRECTSDNEYFDYLEVEQKSCDPNLIYRDLNNIYVWEADNLNHLVLTRFIVHAFSVFEFWVCKAYDEIRSQKKSKNSKMKKLESRLSKYIEAYNSNDSDALESLKEEIFTKTNSYVSSREKIDFVLSEIEYVILKDKEKLDKAKELVTFLFNFRNTIHSVMFNKTERDFTIEIGGTKVELLSGCAPYYENFAKFIHAIHILIDLYCDVFMYLHEKKPANLKELTVDSFNNR